MTIKRTSIIANAALVIAVFAAFYGFSLYRKSHEMKKIIATVKKIEVNPEVENLLLVGNPSISYGKYSKTVKSSYKIILVVDGGCSTCIETLTKWKELFSREKLSYDKMIVFAYDNTYEKISFVQKQLPDFKAPIFFDPDYIFGRLNKIDQNGVDKYLLVDDKLNVITASNPFLDQGIMNTYLHYIK